ncbi:hypothetical protein QOZ88_05845 [Blastococcus sp. BMG 814]|uniref:Uncharacterized protein n=1 Tax=Blastococcus carthaginiensis TaxID=3050034 RepID=A0ABT9I9A9_9ACTN|nr:hypothetical protein [Blastococcus carthaginiensis]MDP5182152.1 hypothetical protein [Blastococcus carthaginiensis]
MPTTGHPHDQAVDDAAWNAVAVASIAHREAEDAADRERHTFAHVLDRGRAHGMTVDDLCAASGLDERFITALLEQADPRRAEA